MNNENRNNSTEYNESAEEWGAVTNKIQAFYNWTGKKYFFDHIDIYRIVLGKVGLTASLAVLMAKYKTGEDTRRPAGQRDGGRPACRRA